MLTAFAYFPIVLLALSAESVPLSAEAQELTPAGSINAAMGGNKQIILAQDHSAVRRHAEAMHKKFFKNAELLDAKQALDRSVAGADVIVYGTPEHAWLARLRERLPFRYDDGGVMLEGRRFQGKRLRVICAIRNPEDAQRRAVLYTAAQAEDVADINAVFHGPTEWVVADGTRILAAGSFVGGELPKEQLIADLDELTAKIKRVHPAAIDTIPAELEAGLAQARRELTVPMRRDQFWLALSRAVQPLRDAHSAVQPLVSGQTLHLPFAWLKDGMIVTADAAGMRKGDRIVLLGAHTEKQLLELLRGAVPAENDHWVRQRGEALLRDFGFLRTANIAAKTPVSVTVERDGKELELTVSFAEAGQARDSLPWVRFEIDEANDLGVFILDQCINNDFYQKTLQRFFETVRAKKITRVAVDVRRNGGGNSNVINEFLRYVDVPSYKTPGSVIRWSEEARARQTGLAKVAFGVMRRAPGEIQNRRVAEPFRGQLLVLTSKATFSSGNWFAVLVQDNKLGKVVGEPTGNAPSSYGDILTFSLPNSALSFTLSFKQWQRPDPKRDPAECVTPDEVIALTRRDVIQGRDPVLEQLRKME